MEPWSIVLIVLAIVVGAAIGVLYAIPKTRPFIKVWWPAFLVVVLTLLILALVVTGRRKGKPDPNQNALDKALEESKERLTEARLEAALNLQKAEMDYVVVQDRLTDANQINDIIERHAAKRRLLEEVQGR